MEVQLTLQHAEQLLDFSQKLDINLLDSVVDCLYNSIGQQQQIAQKILNDFKEHQDAWTKVDVILEYSNNVHTKYYALQILDKIITTRWKTLPRQQSEGIRGFIVGLTIKLSSDPSVMETQKFYMDKLNLTLVQIVKQEWPRHWPSFISDLVGACTTSESVCRNVMTIFRLLSEEVFDFSSGQMTQIKAKHLKDTMCNDFKHIYELCDYVMENSTSYPLVGTTLETLLRFLNWIPLGYVFETKLISTLVYKFLHVGAFRNVTMKCLTEIAGIQREERYAGQYVFMFTWTMEQLKQMLPLPSNPLGEFDSEGHGVYYIKQCYKTGTPQDQNFIQHLALFLCTFLKDHGALVEDKPELQEHLMNAMVYLIQISHVDYREIFKICLEYWNFLTADLYRENPIPWASKGLMLSDGNSSPRRNMYKEVLSELRKIMIQKMAKPEEVIVVENEQGEAVRETMKDTDAMILYKSMRETLVYLTHLDCEDTERIMTEKLFKQVDGSEWSWSNLNKLCWAIGSISGAMTEEDEKRFLVLTIKELLSLVEMKKGKDNKAIIASDIMYIVGQYPRFLRAHWKFLKTVVNKLFEFMHETHDGVQDMACDTFIKIAQKCKRHFVVVQTGEIHPFIDQILMSVTTVICDLQHHQVHTFYEAIGHLVAAQMNPNLQVKLVEKMMTVPNQIWDSIIAKAAEDTGVLQDESVIRELGHILKINVRGCSSIGHPFVVQLGRVYMDMLNLYKCLSENISQAVALSGEMVMKQPLISLMRTVKKETLKFITCWVSQCREPSLVREQFMPPLWDAILADYARNVPDAREPEVLSTTTTIIEKLMENVVDDIPKVFEALFECTLHMINKDADNYPEHRRNFYKMLQATTTHCFPALIRMSNTQFKMILNSVVLGLKHSMRDVSEIGLNIVYTIVKSVLNYPEVSQGFFQLYFMPIVEEIFAVVSEASHTSSLTMHATILSFMFAIIEEDGKITVSLSGQVIAEGSITEQNKSFVQSHLAVLLKQAFPHLEDTLIKMFVAGLFALNKDLQQFKDHLRDFLIQLKEFTGGDVSDLYLEEKEEQLKKAALEKRKAQESVPGIINPYDRTDDNQDMQ